MSIEPRIEDAGEFVFHGHRPLDAEYIMGNDLLKEWNCLQQVAWQEAINSYAFKALTTRREQIAFLFDTLSDSTSAHTIPREMRISHKQIASQFNISRQRAELEAKKAREGVKEPHRPKALTDDQLTKLENFMRSGFERKEWPTYDDITSYIFTEFNIVLRKTTLKAIINRAFKSFTKLVVAEPIEDNRFSVSPEAIDRYYQKLQEILTLIDYRFCFNLDETGEDEFIDTREIKVFVPIDFDKPKAKIPVKRSKKRFTIEHCICTDGTYLPLFIIMPRKTVEPDLFKIYNNDDIIFRTQPKGFMTVQLFEEYFQNVFIPNLAAKRQKYNYNGPALLIMDNLLAHKKAVNCPLDTDYIFLNSLNLHILFLVPHSSDQVQPLDLGVFGNQKRFSQNISKIHGISDSTNLINKAVQGMQQASTTHSIIAAFDSAGITRKIISDGKYETISISLTIDKSKCRAVRHYSQMQTQNLIKGIRIQLPGSKPFEE